jgi:hypothetical protein
LEGFSSTLMMVAADGAAANTASGAASAEGAVAAMGGVVAGLKLSTVGAFDPVRLMSPHAAVIATPPSRSQTKLFLPMFEEKFWRSFAETPPRIRVYSFSFDTVSERRLGRVELGLGCSGCCKMHVPH